MKFKILITSLAAVSMIMSCSPKTEDSEFRSVIRLWSVHHLSDEIEGQLIDAFKKYPKSCDEVWFLAGEDTSAPVEDYEMEKLKKAADDVRNLGIIVSYQDISVGHNDNVPSPDGLTQDGYRSMVGIDGKTTLTQTCPRDTAFASRFAAKYATVCAAIHPENVMIDDDLRLTQHEPARYACYCDHCISEFNSEYHHGFNRETLWAALDGNAEGIRTEWIEFSQNSLAMFARRVAEEVHKVSPESHMGLQHAAFHTELLEGWDWNKIFDAMREVTGNTVSSRPGHRVYNDHAPREFIVKAYGISRQIARLKGDFHMIFPEIEGYKHRATGKSPQGVCTETLMYLSMGANSMTYALICNNFEPMEWYADNYFKYLDRYHDLFSAYVAFNKDAVGAGIDDYMSPSLVLRNEPNWMLTDAGSNCIKLSPLGIPFTPEASRCTASILDDRNINAMSREELQAFVSSHGTVMDINGWDCVVKKGYTDLFKPTTAPDGLLEGTQCYTAGGKRIAVLESRFNYDISGAERHALLNVFDWVSDSSMYVFPETFSQCITIPRADSESGSLRSVTYVNATITDQENITLRLRNCPAGAKFSWEDVNGSHKLKAVHEGNDVLVTIPFINAWDAGWIKVRS